MRRDDKLVFAMVTTAFLCGWLTGTPWPIANAQQPTFASDDARHVADSIDNLTSAVKDCNR
jgi:isocitrate lyase